MDYECKVISTRYQHYRRYFLPLVAVLNPDGYEYTHTTNRNWMKNRRRNSGPKCDDGILCHGSEHANGVMVDSYGVDLNRNFGKGFGEGGASSDPCSIFYTGPEAMSRGSQQPELEYLSTANIQNVQPSLGCRCPLQGQYDPLPLGLRCRPAAAPLYKGDVAAGIQDVLEY